MSEDMETKVSEESVEELLQEIYSLEDNCEAYATRIEELEREVTSLKKIKEENEVLRKEIAASYKYNDTINKWWKFKLERLELSHNHDK
jgi:DNA repair exonuclease SbcCD ATPase subunit